jgi:hypothetical protein
MSAVIRNRIKGHRRVRAGDLVPHEWNKQQLALLQRFQAEGLACKAMS